ncbi:uncharacterized protein C2845_PM17G07910 [Panicum miliaceum]|uniref:Uncharacterized protein n=1 Tax=Panicum miliaceum TaxID=4540 RepID=A0A3L6PZ19_PANMI|nr:uncharacterized protein C2845_PM17G07910 [Panicum miliaceum]
MAPPTAPRKVVAVELSAMEPESDEHVDVVNFVDSTPAAAKPHETVALSARSSGSSDSSSLLKTGGAGPRPVGVAGDRASSSEQGTNEPGSSKSDSEAIFVSTKDPVVIAEELNASGAKLIGGRFRGCVRFDRGKHERQILLEASSSFCLPMIEKELMNTGTANVLRCAEDLALKALLAACCASRQLGNKSAAMAEVASLKEQVAKLEEEKVALAIEVNHERIQLAAATEKSRNLEKELKKAQAEAATAKTELADCKEKWLRIKNKLTTMRRAIANGVKALLSEMPEFMLKYGLTNPELETEGLDVNQFFDWLWSCLAMLDAGSKLYGDLSAVVAAQTLAASVCGLLPSEATSSPVIVKTQLETLCSDSFGWPLDEAVRPENLPALPKNIAKNFMESFLKGQGSELVHREGLCIHE